MEKPITSDPFKHQRDVGEREHDPNAPRPRAGEAQLDEAVAHAREKANKNNTHRNEQTGKAAAEAGRTRQDAERAA